MPLDPNNPNLKLGGRKGYEFEKEQLEKMSKLLGKDLALLEKILDGKATNKEIERFKLVKERMLKYLDKLHPSKTDMKMEVEKPIMIL